jgi:cytochrome c
MLDGASPSNGQSVDLLGLPLGAHVLSVSAADRAGNASSRTVEFRVVATIDTLITAVNAFANRGQIDAQASRSLLSTLADAKASLDRGSVSSATGKLRDFRDHVAAQSGRSIAPAAAAVLLTDCDYVLGVIGG